MTCSYHYTYNTALPLVKAHNYNTNNRTTKVIKCLVVIPTVS